MQKKSHFPPSRYHEGQTVWGNGAAYRVVGVLARTYDYCGSPSFQCWQVSALKDPAFRRSGESVAIIELSEDCFLPTRYQGTIIGEEVRLDLFFNDQKGFAEKLHEFLRDLYIPWQEYMLWVGTNLVGHSENGTFLFKQSSWVTPAIEDIFRVAERGLASK